MSKNVILDTRQERANIIRWSEDCEEDLHFTPSSGSANTESYITLRSKQEAEYLIAAVQKTIDLGWYKE